MTSMGNKVAKSLNKNGTRTLETDILWCNDLPFKSVTTTATLRLHLVCLYDYNIFYKIYGRSWMWFSYQLGVWNNVSVELLLWIPKSRMQKILHSKSLDFKPESPLNMKKIIISKSEKMHINLFTLYFGASHAMICSYLAKSDDQRYILQLLLNM